MFMSSSSTKNSTLAYETRKNALNNNLRNDLRLSSYHNSFCVIGMPLFLLHRETRF
uniref:Uncharacterized protein n=1 Tax=Nelumbo nucifera TaxID=4432 RepID=A0A822YTZ7_NELNU|nr:TPA_asm: hypothetical protein HUJ06_006762 [Nelumbo nucifera]